MAALTEARLTRKRELKTLGRAMAAGVKIFEGSLVALTAAGYATPGATATTLIADGLALETVDNSAGIAAAKTVEVERGCFNFANSAAADAITVGEIGDDCYIVDDQTVAKTSGGATRSIAGKIIDVDAAGVWVLVGIR